MTRLIAGLPFTVINPSMFVHGRTAMAYDGQAWRVATHRDSWQWGQRPFATREAAATLIRDAFTQARENLA